MPGVNDTLRYKSDFPRCTFPVPPWAACVTVPSKSLASCRAYAVRGAPAKVRSVCSSLRDMIFQEVEGCATTSVPVPAVTV